MLCTMGKQINYYNLLANEAKPSLSEGMHIYDKGHAGVTHKAQDYSKQEHGGTPQKADPNKRLKATQGKESRSRGSNT